MLDGTGLRQSWYTALEDAQSYFRQLLTSSSQEWKRVPVPSENGPSSPKGKARASAFPELTDVVLHRKSAKSGENVYRAVLDVPTGEEPMSLECWKAVLATPELRKEWDPAVEGAHLVEMFDQTTRIAKTNFSVGWPANPRDAVTISRMFNDATTLIDISTSLPRSPDEPAYLRPSPPYVRSDVTLFAWCVQHVLPPGEQSTKNARLRITCFWQHNFRLIWNFGSTSSFAQQLSAMMVGLFKSVKKRGMRIPLLTGYGNGVAVERIRFALDREALTLDYAIVPEDEEHAVHTSEQGLEELHAIREHRRLTRAIECALPASAGWDVQIATKASSEQVSQLPWTVHATRSGPSSSSETLSDDYEKVVFGIKHASLPNDHSVLKVKVVIELSGPSSGIRLNGIPQPIEEVEERDPSSYFISEQMLQDVSSTADLSFNTQSSFSTAVETASRSSTLPDRPQLMRRVTERTAVADKSILSRVKRNYIYFSSLLQEPEAKWKRTTEARGVSIAQLDSIDPTLVVYRAESTFVGLGLWDLYSAVVTPGARAYWDKLYEDGILVEDVNELTELWHYKTKPAWPANGRDAVVLKTVYKSPTTIHVFAFSADDPNLFPHIPPADPNVIRMQIDLQGWAIEALSPTTTQLTLLEQSDPKGWSNKGSIPQQMIGAVAGVGEFAIKCGGPPVLTRLEGAKANGIRYDHDRGSFRIEYEASASRRSSEVKNTDDAPASPVLPVIECELRCDLDNWASSLDIVVDPPPQSTSCLRRHRLSSGGGGLWLTITHDVVTTGQERLLAIVRRGPVGVQKEKGLVMVNGSKVDVDVEDMPEREVKHLTKQKRVKPSRVPLDQPPVLSVIRRRNAEWNAEVDSDSTENGSEKPVSPTALEGIISSQPKFATSFTRFFNYAVEQATTTTQQAVAAISPAIAAGADSVPSATKPPMQYALEALSYLQSIHNRPVSDDWTLVSERDFPVHRKLDPEISPVVPVHRGEKVIEGVSAEEVASVLVSYDCRKHWDNRFDSVHVLEVFGADSHTGFVVMKGGFPFRDRGFYLASLTARESVAPRRNTGESEQSSENRTAIFCVSASFSPDSVSSFSSSKYNSYALPVGRVFVDGWILETLDPYGKESYAIPSTRCTRVVAVDYAGSIPAALNSMINGMLPKSILAVETYVKNMSPPPSMRLPAAVVVVAPATEDEPLPKSWTVRRRDASRALIATIYIPTDRVYRSFILLDSSALLSPAAVSSANEKTPKAGRIALGSPAAVSEGQRPASPHDQLSSAGRSRSPDAVRSPTIFTSRGELRHPTDILVSELIVDSKLYPDGYDVRVKSRIEKTKAVIPLPALSTDETLSDHSLPISYSVYTLPPSPLHSSGLNADRPPRHLLRLTLPTAQYQVSTLQDPLTGETRSAPPKPQWLSDIEEGRVIISVEIVPAPAGRANKTSTVTVDGKAVTVLSEKESLTGLGREELLDSRASRMDLLSGSPVETEELPEELQVPVAIAEHLLGAAVPEAEAASVAEAGDPESAHGTPEPGEEGSESHVQVAVAPAEAPAPDSAASGLLRFLNAYQNPLQRFAAQTRKLTGGADPASGAGTCTPRSAKEDAAAGVAHAEEGQGRVGVLMRRGVANTMYPLSTVVIVAVIAFLIGSLLRSLLSPSDFVHLVTDRRDIDEVGAGGGWREIKRLLEVKYVLGGWDFQVAVVRRH
ncbi:hypothetical protein SCP_1601180 [Sparassis crispa]|uniref:START domain-containing protein n=1 Tax=Sparassis crispa TaxID=139825 RepID=A0A401H4T0_9APHY|nr:hypothetical protein SCP_1601180 [Sparassis crispa]GBE89456.1 hypothetical protein SCP_1601180 [Sparassis crispa]